jgi:hypothetical protein
MSAERLNALSGLGEKLGARGVLAFEGEVEVP